MVYHGIPTILVHQILQIPIRIPEVCPTQEVPPELGRNQLWRARSACARWDSSFGPWTESDPEKVKANVSWSPGASKLQCSLPSPRWIERPISDKSWGGVVLGLPHLGLVLTTQNPVETCFQPIYIILY